jgi:hypothetical protein
MAWHGMAWHGMAANCKKTRHKGGAMKSRSPLVGFPQVYIAAARQAFLQRLNWPIDQQA